MNGSVVNGTSSGFVHAPVAAVVGQSSSPQATGTLANADVPVTATSSGGAPAPAIPVVSQAATVPSSGTGGASSSLIDVVAPVQA